MRKSIILICILTVITVLASCAGLLPTSSPTPSNGGVTPEASPIIGPTEDTMPVAGAAVLAFLDGEPSAAEVASYLRENTPALKPVEADVLLERLVLLQLDIAEDMNRRIWDEPYMTALNDTMGGTLDAAKIANIKDADVRSAFQNVSDALMTMVRYEETPVFEPDWEAIAALDAAFGDDMAAMITYESRLQGRYYTGDPDAFNLMAADIVDTGKLIGGMDNGFARWQLKQVYDHQISRLLFGPEGTYLEAFATDDEETMRRIDHYAGIYADSEFGKLCAQLLDNQDAGQQTLSDAIMDTLLFPPGDPRMVTKTALDQDGAHITLPVLSGMTDTAAEEQINAAVKDAAVSLAGAGNSPTVDCYVSFAGDAYLCFSFLVSYQDESGQDHYTETYKTFDAVTGAAVTLDTLFGKPLDMYADALLQQLQGDQPAPEDLSASVEFAIWEEGLTLLVPSPDSDWPDYYSVTYNRLRGLMDISLLY